MNRRTTAVLLSGLAFPGAGQMYLKRYVKGAFLMAAAAGLVGAVVYKTVEAAWGLMLSMPQEELAGSLLPLARKVLESGRGFYDACGIALVAVWAIGIIDAYISGKG